MFNRTNHPLSEEFTVSRIYDGPAYACIEEGIDMFKLRYQQVVNESLPRLRYTDSVTIKTDKKELTACYIASGYSDGTRYYLGMDGIIYIFDELNSQWISATPEYFAQMVRSRASELNGVLNVPSFLSRIEDVLCKCEILARSPKSSEREVDTIVKKVKLEYCI